MGLQGDNGTGRHQLPNFDDEPELVKGKSSMPPKQDDPIPTHLTKTKMVVDFIKYVGALVIGIAAFGWMAVASVPCER